MISAGSVSYALIFLGLYLIAHVITRYTVPWSDPYLLPLAGLLTAIGLTEIYRLGSTDAFRQGFWIVVGVGVFAVTLILLRDDFRVLENYKYLFGVSAVGLLMLPALPGIGTTINGARLWVKVGPIQFQPGELAKIALIVFLAGYLREKREVLAQGRLKDFGPLLLIWGAAMLVLRRDQRPRQCPPLLRDLPGHAVRRHRTGALRRDRARALRRRCGGRVPDGRARAGARRHLAEPLAGPAREGLPARPGPRTRSRTAASGAPVSAAARSPPRAAPT